MEQLSVRFFKASVAAAASAFFLLFPSPTPRVLPFQKTQHRNSFEALIGAIYLDGGLEASRAFILRRAEEHLNHVITEPEEINPKGRLQELLQSFSAAIPTYELLEETGAAHLKQFRCCVFWNGKTLGVGEGGDYYLHSFELLQKVGALFHVKDEVVLCVAGVFLDALFFLMERCYSLLQKEC